jgi:hypothetical protein
MKSGQTVMAGDGGALVLQGAPGNQQVAGFQVDDRISIPGFQGSLREWHIDAIGPSGASCHLVSQPETQETWPLGTLLTVGQSLRRPTWVPAAASSN